MFALLLSTRNSGKVAEIAQALEGLPVRLLTPADVTDAPEVEEDKPTLEGNARKKAETLHRHTGLPTLADDTGLEVEALDGRPGVYSARYAGPQATDADNRACLLEELANQTNRTARFRTVLAFVEDGEAHLFEGICSGRILETERGTGGFGYDALFVPDGYTHTFAELTKTEKNAISHRGQAVHQFADFLRQRQASRATSDE